MSLNVDLNLLERALHERLLKKIPDLVARYSKEPYEFAVPTSTDHGRLEFYQLDQLINRKDPVPGIKTYVGRLQDALKTGDMLILREMPRICRTKEDLMLKISCRFTVADPSQQELR